MSFMHLYVSRFPAYVVETADGSDIVPVEIVGETPALEDLAPYCDGEPVALERVEGYFARYSAPGYMDCTPWAGPYDTAEEAEKECRALFGGEDECEG